MDESTEHGARIEDLPVEAEQAAEVKGGINFGGAIALPAVQKVIVPDGPERY